MEEPIAQRGMLPRPVLFVLFLVCGIVMVVVLSGVYAPNLPNPIVFSTWMGLAAGFLAAALILKRRDSQYWEVMFAFFVASFSLLFSRVLRLDDWHLRALNLELNTAEGVAVAKLSDSLLIVIAILVLTKLAGRDMASLFLKRSNSMLGLVVGFVAFTIFAVLSVLNATSQGIGLTRIIAWAPWVLVFVLSNGFMEELLFRGLFLKKYELFFGATLSNLLAAIIFTLAHFQVTYTPDIVVFLVITFLFALAFGYLMQRTDSLWGPALFHAGTDLLIILGILAEFGAT